WPKVGTMDLTSHVAALKAVKPDLIFSSLLFADLPVFMKQAHAAELTKDSKLVFPAAGWQHTLMKKEFTPEGILFGHNTFYFDNPNGSPLAKEFVAWYERTYKDYPEWEADRAYFAIASYKAAVENAAKVKNGSWPSQDDVIDAMAGVSGENLGGKGAWGKGYTGEKDVVAGVPPPKKKKTILTPGRVGDLSRCAFWRRRAAPISGTGSKRPNSTCDLPEQSRSAHRSSSADGWCRDGRVRQYSPRRRVSRRRLVLGCRRAAARFRGAEDPQSCLRLVLRARCLFRSERRRLCPRCRAFVLVNHAGAAGRRRCARPPPPPDRAPA